jgi:menaquinone-dependent protoporphyrinogen oxidase
MRPRILVTYGSKRGGTAEIADKIAQTLRARGLDADCRRASHVDDLRPYDTVIVGGALYMFRWVREARRFVERHAQSLRARRVWMFSSGPLDDTANHHEIAPTRQIGRLSALANARGHVTFGGRLAADARGFIASAMAKTKAGDWRDWERVRAWAADIADALAAEPSFAVAEPPRRATWPLVALSLVVALTAIAGGLALVAAPDGSIVHMPLSQLAHAPFASYLIPGLTLLVVIGFGHLAAAILVIRRSPLAPHVAFAAGAALIIWIATQLAMIRTFHVLQLAYALAGAAIVVLAARLLPARMPGVRRRLPA